MTFTSNKAQKTRQTIFSQVYYCNTNTVFWKVPRANSRSLQGLWFCTVSYSSTSCGYSSYMLPLQTRAIPAQALIRSQIYSQQGKRSRTRLFLSSLKWPSPSPAQCPEADRACRGSVLPSHRKCKEHKFQGILKQPVRRDTLGELRWKAHPSTSLASFPTCSYFEVSS